MHLTMSGAAAPLLALIIICATIAFVAWINRNRPKPPDITFDQWLGQPPRWPWPRPKETKREPD